MPLKLKNLEAVEIGEFSAVPIVNAENLLRLSQVNLGTAEGREKAVEVMADCFPKAKEAAQNAIGLLPIFELCKLQAYLIGGDEAVNALMNELRKGTELSAAQGEEGLRDE